MTQPACATTKLVGSIRVRMEEHHGRNWGYLRLNYSGRPGDSAAAPTSPSIVLPAKSASTLRILSMWLKGSGLAY
jgi:hypothetical protein